MDGILNLNKPAGMTSHDVVDRVRRILKIKKVGHAGTLDPEATGVLLILVGKATKLAQKLQGSDKEYKGEMVLGIATDTQDAQGKIIKKVDKVEISLESIRNAFKQFRGKIKQVPPMVSAVSIGGKRLYKLAREGIEIPRPAREIEIYKLQILDYKEGEYPQVFFEVACSKGTYIRTLCADIGEVLGCGAHQSNLVRTRAGKFKLENSITLENLRELGEKNEVNKVFYKI
jgi:tRNA pseudouridine55 synthase